MITSTVELYILRTFAVKYIHITKPDFFSKFLKGGILAKHQNVNEHTMSPEEGPKVSWVQVCSV